MPPVCSRRWICRGDEAALAGFEALTRELSISPLIARTLHFRGIVSAEQGREFLQTRLSGLPDPFLLSGMAPAVERLAAAVEARERIAVHGDYDVDGITGTALLVEVLRTFGAEVDYFIPLRLRDGYGLSAEAIEKAAAAGARVIVTVDCGISAFAEAIRAAELGLDLIVTDHHHPSEQLPKAYALINPRLPGEQFPDPGLAGVGVAFFLSVALRRELRERGHFSARPEPDLRRVLDLVALGTIADIVPLQGVNRALVRVGLGVLSRAGRPGIEALKRVAAVDDVTCSAVAFRLAPRLNAAGRLEDAGLGVELLLASSATEASAIAEELDACNRERQRIEEETLRQAVERMQEGSDGRTIVLADRRWHPGVIGIVASRLVERYHRPAVLIALEEGRGKGSARSIPGFHLFHALQHCAEHLEAFGGHECAAGLTLAEEALGPFAAAFEAAARDGLTEEALLPCLYHDGEVLLEEVTLSTIRDIGNLAPFGAGNPEPSFIVTAIVPHQVRPVGQNHLRFTARQGGYSLPCIAFGMAERIEELRGEIDLLFTPMLNEWRNTRTVQLRVRDCRPASPFPAAPIAPL